MALPTMRVFFVDKNVAKMHLCDLVTPIFENNLLVDDGVWQ
jgi:hypothetical protein